MHDHQPDDERDPSFDSLICTKPSATFSPTSAPPAASRTTMPYFERAAQPVERLADGGAWSQPLAVGIEQLTAYDSEHPPVTAYVAPPMRDAAFAETLRPAFKGEQVVWLESLPAADEQCASDDAREDEENDTREDEENDTREDEEDDTREEDEEEAAAPDPAARGRRSRRIAVATALGALSLLTMLTLVAAAGSEAASSPAATPTKQAAPKATAVVEHLGSVDLRPNAPKLTTIARKRLDSMVPIIIARDHQHVAVSLVTRGDACASTVSAYLANKNIPHQIRVEQDGEAEEVAVRLIRK